MESLYRQPWMLVQNKIRGRGGREIDKLRGVSPAQDIQSGSEAWIGSTTPVGRPPEDTPHYGCSEVILPDGRRMYLFEAIELNPDAVLGKTHIAQNGHGMGMLIKYLDAQFQYGLQCHPTRPWAKKMWNSDYGKEESWYVISVRDDAGVEPYIILGFKEGVTREIFEREYRTGDIKRMEALCHRINVKVGETYFVGGGVPHALGEGCLVIEVQEPSDITLGALPLSEARRKAWNISDEDAALYDERLLGAYEYDGCSYEENLNRWLSQPDVIRSGDWGSEAILLGPKHTTFFSFTQVDCTDAVEVRQTGFPQVGIVLEGSGKITFDGGEFALNKADEFFLPYDVPNAKFVPNGDMKVVLCHPEGVAFD